MSNDEISSERRIGRVAGIAGLVGVLAFILSGLIGGSDYNAAEGLAEQITVFESEKGSIFAQLLVQALGIALFAAPIMALFLAASARSDSVRRGLLGVTVAGPIFLAGSLIALYLALDAVSEPFLNSVGVDIGSDDDARDVLRDQSAYSVYGGLDFAGRLGLVFAMVYTSLHAMRTGLMTRFWGTLGMALGAALLFIGPAALLVFALAVSLLVANLWPGGRPPAWEAGTAVPWPDPKAPPPEPEPEEAARPEDFEGTATEVDAERPGRRDNKRKRKRKQRG